MCEGVWEVHERCTEGVVGINEICFRYLEGVQKVPIATIDLVGDNREIEV